MAVKIKLMRMGKVRAPYYRIVVADARTKRDGRGIETIGKYHPTHEPSLIEVDSERAQYWLGVGAQPTEPVAAILKVTGDWQKFRGEPGAEGTLRVAEPKADKKTVFEAAAKDSSGQAKEGATTPRKRAAKKATATKKAAASETPAAATDAAASETPAFETSATETSASETSASETPAAATDAAASETPAFETSAADAAAGATETPATETPASETPASETPAAPASTEARSAEDEA